MLPQSDAKHVPHYARFRSRLTPRRTASPRRIFDRRGVPTSEMLSRFLLLPPQRRGLFPD